MLKEEVLIVEKMHINSFKSIFYNQCLDILFSEQKKYYYHFSGNQGDKTAEKMLST